MIIQIQPIPSGLDQFARVAIAQRTSPIDAETPRRSMAKHPGVASNLGLYVYGGAAIFLGLLGLISGDFATTWQNVAPNVPLRVPLAYLTAVIELAGGIALLVPRTARAGALTLTIVYSVFTLIWVPKAFVNLGN